MNDDTVALILFCLGYLLGVGATFVALVAGGVI